MAMIKITAKLKDLPHGYGTFVAFKTRNGKRMEAEPIVSESKGEVCWLVPDTDENRELFDRNFPEGGAFTADTVNQKTPEPFKAGKKPEGK